MSIVEQLAVAMLKGDELVIGVLLDCLIKEISQMEPGPYIDIIEQFRYALIEEYACPVCLGRLNRYRQCSDQSCNYDAHIEWIELGGDDEHER